MYYPLPVWHYGDAAGQRPNRNPAFENNRPDRLLARAHPGQLLVATSRQAHIGYTPCLYRPNREPNRKNANFENAARGTGKHSGIFFDDSDVYKALEGIAYSLITTRTPNWKRKRTNGSTRSRQPNNRTDISIHSTH